MKRKELFEFEDFNWFPKSIRIGMTNLIMVLHKMMGTTEVLSKLILDLRQTTDFDAIVDLGSGSGGPMPEVVKTINEAHSQHQIQLILTDLHPNADKIRMLNADPESYITYHKDPVNAANLSKAPKGLKTMIASFHHMKPSIAKRILQSASESKSPILIYEIAKNNIPFVIWLLLLPISLSILVLMALVMTPFSKNLTFTQLFFTYIIPIIPLAYAWDGQASLMRTYTFEDIQMLLSDLDTSNFTWQMDDAKKANGKKLGYYVLGYPKTE